MDTVNMVLKFSHPINKNLGNQIEKCFKWKLLSATKIFFNNVFWNILSIKYFLKCKN